jgi:transposase-like protein
MQLRKATRNRGRFPSDEAAAKLLYLALRDITAERTRPPANWAPAASQFAIQFGTRFFAPQPAAEQKTQPNPKP